MNNKETGYFVQSKWGKPSRLALYFLLILCFIGAPLNAQRSDDLRVMTFNIRYGTANDGENSWEFRKDKVAQTIGSFKPDILGLQEALRIQIDELLSMMPEYAYAGVGRDDGKSAGEHSCIFYLKERFEVDSAGTFWFSDTPEIAGSKSWGNNITRICTWLLLKDKFSGMEIYHFNLHFDHESQPSREKSAELTIRRINEKKLPLILTGDFNCGEENPAMQKISAAGLIDTYRSIHSRLPDEGTFNSFKGEKSGDRIDFIFATKDFSVEESQIVRTNFEGRFPSDHFPVISVLRYIK